MKTYHVLMNLDNPLRSRHHRVDEAVLGVTVKANSESEARVSAKMQVYMLGNHNWTIAAIEEESGCSAR